MEVTAIGTDLLLAAGATIEDVLYWSVLIFSLSGGFLVAFPVNVALVHLGVKDGMKSPRDGWYDVLRTRNGRVGTSEKR
jgi:hypothetical protein